MVVLAGANQKNIEGKMSKDQIIKAVKGKSYNEPVEVHSLDELNSL